MLQKFRTSIARLMGVVLIAGLGFAALRISSEAAAGTMLLVTCGAMLLAVVGAVCRGPADRACWLGFALFGGGYLALAHGTSFSSSSTLPTITLAEFVRSELGKTPATPLRGRGEGFESLPPLYRILHCLWALGLAVLGWLLAGVFIASPATPAPESVSEGRSERPRARIPGKWPALIGLSVFWLAAFAAAVGRWPASGIWAGISFLLTCSLLGTAALGAVYSRGRARESWLAAALFGFGYLALSFGKSDLFIVAPHLPAESMINSLIRSGVPPVESDFADFTTPRYFRIRAQTIRKKLDQPTRFHFPKETPLDEVLKYVRSATRDTNFPGIPIYVDPIGLQTAERSLNSTVQIDIDAIPVRDGLRLCLKQLGLGFSVRDGFMMITDEDSAAIPVYEDSVQVVGHSLVALIAAGLGAVAAPFFLERLRRPRRPDHSTA